jgi:hypothetical protein
MYEKERILSQLHSQLQTITSEFQRLPQPVQTNSVEIIFAKIFYELYRIQSEFISRNNSRDDKIDELLIMCCASFIQHLQFRLQQFNESKTVPAPVIIQPTESQQPPKLPKEPVQEAPKAIAPVINIHIEIKIASPPTLPVKSEPTIDLQPNTIPSIPEEKIEAPIVPIIVKDETQNKQGSDVSTFQLNGADYPTTVIVSVKPTTFPIVPNVVLEVPPTGPGPPARYNLRSKEKGKKDVCCINGCKETK